MRLSPVCCLMLAPVAAVGKCPAAVLALVRAHSCVDGRVPAAVAGAAKKLAAVRAGVLLPLPPLLLAWQLRCGWHCCTWVLAGATTWQAPWLARWQRPKHKLLSGQNSWLRGGVQEEFKKQQSSPELCAT